MGRVVVAAILIVSITLVTERVPRPATAHHGEGPATVAHVIDGDTFDILRPRGTERVRMFGIDAPPAGTACGDAATRALRRWLAESGNRVYLELGPRSSDGNGRALYYVWQRVGGDWLLVDDDMAYEGYAYAWIGEGQHGADIAASERSARANRRGCLWR